jgi:hypothetical protein
MANSHLKTKIGSDWNELIRGKVKVEADPFAAAPMPTFATKPMTGGSASQPTSPPPPPKVFDDAKEIEGFIDTLMLRGRMPQSIVDRLKAIEATWRQQGRLMYADYNFLKTQAKSRKRY